MKENKWLTAAFAGVLIVLLIFGSVQIPGAHSTPKHLQIGLVVEDEGEMGHYFASFMQENVPAAPGVKEPMIDWVLLDSKKQMKKQMADQVIYGAIIIPTDFTHKYNSLQSSHPVSPELQIYINQGKNTTVAKMVNQGLTGMAEQVNFQVSNQLLSVIEQNNIPLTVEQARIYTSPIQSSIENLHMTGDLGNAPMSFFQPVWMASVVSAVFLWLAGKNRSFTTRIEQLKFRINQIVLVMLLGILTGFTLPWITTWMLDYNFENYISIALFLSITCISFILMILAVITWIGYVGLPIFILFMFYGLPLIQLTPEMMPAFYKDWIYPWLPMRFMFDGVKEILFYSGEVWNDGAILLVWIGAAGILLLLTKIYVPSKEELLAMEPEPVK